MRRSLVLRRRLAYVRSRLVLMRRLAYVRSRLVLVRRRTRSVVIVRRPTRCAGAMRSLHTLVRVSWSGRVVRARDVVGTVGVRCSSGMGIGRVCTFGRASDIVVGRL